MKEFEDRVRQYLQERNWDELRPSDLAKSIMIEGAELLELFQWENLSPAVVQQDAEKMAKIRKELADVMVYCFDLAVTLDIDVETMLAEKMERIREKYPPELFNKDTRTGDPGTEERYWKVKEKYRREGRS